MVRFAGPKSLVTESLRHKSFAVRYLTLFGGETFSKVCVMAAFAYLAHVLPASDYGTIEWALSVTVFFVLGVESGMGLYGARVVAAAPERIPQLVPQIMLLRVVLGVPAFALILAVSAYYRVAGLGILAVNGIAVLLTPFLTQWVFQGLRQMQWVAAGSAIRNFTFVALYPSCQAWRRRPSGGAFRSLRRGRARALQHAGPASLAAHPPGLE